MKIRVVTLPWDADSREFSEAKLLEATQSSDVLDFDTKWTCVDGRECLVIVLKLTGGGQAGAGNGSFKSSFGMQKNDVRRQKAIEYIRKLEEQMPEANKAVFYKLKEWRAEKANGTKAPVFAIANNRQLAELALRAPKSIKEIREIQGCGEMFVKNYSKEILELVKDVSRVEYTLPDTDEEGKEKENEPKSQKKESSLFPEFEETNKQ